MSPSNIQQFFLSTFCPLHGAKLASSSRRRACRTTKKAFPDISREGIRNELILICSSAENSARACLKHVERRR